MNTRVTETGVRRLAGQLFNCNTSRALKESKIIIQRYKNGAGIDEIAIAIREARARVEEAKA